MAEDEEKDDWLKDFVGIMSGGAEVVGNVADAINKITGKNLPSPVSVPTAQQQAQESQDVQGEQRVPGPGQLDVAGLLPVLAIVVILILLVKA